MAILSLLVAAAVLCSAGLLPFVIAADGGFKENCNVWSAQLEGQDLGLYCENKNTAMYGYNWTWYFALPFPSRRTSGSIQRLPGKQHPEDRDADGCAPGSVSTTASVTGRVISPFQDSKFAVSTLSLDNIS